MARSLDEAANEVCRKLPAGWTIQIELELDSGSVSLLDEEGDMHVFPTSHEDMESELFDALEYAIVQAQQPGEAS